MFLVGCISDSDISPRPVPEDFGAIGDGRSDDSDAVRQWLVSGPRIALKRGSTYLARGPLSVPSKLDLEGRGATLRLSAYEQGLRVHDVSQVRLSNFTIEMGFRAGGTPIWFGQAIDVVASETMHDILLHRVRVVGSPSYGIHVLEKGDGEIYNLTIARCTIADASGRGISVNAARGSKLKISNCHVRRCGLQGVVVTAGNDVDIVSTSVEHVGDHGIVLGGLAGVGVRGVAVKGCEVALANKYGIAVSMSVQQWRIEDNYVRECADGGVTVDVELTGQLQQIQRSNGVVRGNSIAGGRIGILLRYARGVRVLRNSIETVSRAGVALHSSYGNYVTHNTFDSVGVPLERRRNAGQRVVVPGAP